MLLPCPGGHLDDSPVATRLSHHPLVTHTTDNTKVWAHVDQARSCAGESPTSVNVCILNLNQLQQNT